MIMNWNFKLPNAGVLLIMSTCITLLTVNTVSLEKTSDFLPCYFVDSINITAGVRQPNGSIIFNDILFSAEEIATVNYTLVNGTKHVPVTPHTRGCLCSRGKSCVRLCCPHGSLSEYNNGRHICRTHEAAKDLEGEIVDENNHTKTVKLHQHFSIVDHRPCEEFFYLDEYQLTHVIHTFKSKWQNIMSSVEIQNVWFPERRSFIRKYVVKSQGVLYFSKFEQRNQQVIFGNVGVLWRRWHYGDRSDLYPPVWYVSIFGNFNFKICNTSVSLLRSGMQLSVVFIIITIVIFCLIPKLRNLHGKCLMCYSASLAVGYGLLAWVLFNVYNYVPEWLCKSGAYAIYCSSLSSFLWLSALNFDLWLDNQWVQIINISSLKWVFFTFSQIKTYICFLNSIFQVNELLVWINRLQAIPFIFDLQLWCSLSDFNHNVHLGLDKRPSGISSAWDRHWILLYEM